MRKVLEQRIEIFYHFTKDWRTPGEQGIISNNFCLDTSSPCHLRFFFSVSWWMNSRPEIIVFGILPHAFNFKKYSKGTECTDQFSSLWISTGKQLKLWFAYLETARMFTFGRVSNAIKFWKLICEALCLCGWSLACTLSGHTVSLSSFRPGKPFWSWVFLCW